MADDELKVGVRSVDGEGVDCEEDEVSVFVRLSVEVFLTVVWMIVVCCADDDVDGPTALELVLCCEVVGVFDAIDVLPCPL